MRKETMKKRIISLILVVAMAFLTLTGCAYNYSKDDMSKYAAFDTEAFYNALQALNITDGDFGTDEEGRKVKVQDAIAQAILKITDTTDMKFAGKLEKFDSLYFAYYATDDMGNVFFASKMDETKLTNVQLGLSTLEGLNKLISDGALSLEDVASYIYSTSGATVVGNGDVIAISYEKTWMDGETEKSETADRVYFTVVTNGENNKVKPLSEFLVGKQVGVNLGDVTLAETAGEETVNYTYKNVKVESIVKDNSTVTVADGDKVFVTYTVTFDAEPWLNTETGKYELPAGYLDTNIDAEGTYKETFTMDLLTVVADAELPEGATAEEKEAAKTFLGQLVGKTTGTTNTITVKNGTIGDKTVEVKYTGVKVNWVVNSEMNPFTVKFTPYEEELKEDNSNKKTETSVKGEKVILNGEELTYYIFPVYYLDVESASAELIIREFYSTVASTQTAEHEHTDEEHEHTTEFVFDTLNGNYKNGDKKLSALVEELVKLYTTLTEKEKTETEALKSLTTAYSNLAKDDGKSESETASLVSKKDNAHTTYLTAKKAVTEAQTKVDEKIAEILACKDGEKDLNADLVADYETYQYDTLEAAYKADIKEKLAAKVIDYLTKNVKFESNLPKKAVKNAYNAIMNTYKYDFYEGKYSSSTSSSTSTSTSTETNYVHYKGDFNAYLIDKVTSNKGTMSDVKAAIQTQAEETVKEIIMIYVFAAAVDAKWDADVTLTKAEKKEIKKNLETTALLYQQYGLSFTYNVDDSYHAQQFDKAMNYLLEENETEGNVVEYKHVKYTTEAQEA